MVLTIKHGVWECDEFVGGKKKKGSTSGEKRESVVTQVCSASNVR